MALDGTTTTAPRQGTWRRIAPPDRRRETVSVVRAAFWITAVALLWIGRHAVVGSLADGSGPAPWEIAFSKLAPPLQRDLRELHEGAEEALRLRADEGRWPDVAQLRANAIAPFAPLPGRREPRTFERADVPFVVQYIGTGPGARTLLAQFVEPRPGENEAIPGVPFVEDERHRLLPDGNVLHVSFWIGPEVVAAAPASATQFLRDPAFAGFQEVLRGEGAAGALAGE